MPTIIDNALIPDCWVCKNDGFILYNRKTHYGNYEYLAHCECKHGIEYIQKPIKTKEHEYKGYTKAITEVLDPLDLADNNLKAFIEKHKNNQAIMVEMKRRGIRGEP